MYKPGDRVKLRNDSVGVVEPGHSSAYIFVKLDNGQYKALFANGEYPHYQKGNIAEESEWDIVEKLLPLPTENTDKGLKFDTGKPQLSYVPLSAKEAIARALAYGANKYGKNNYKLGMKWSRIADALDRHMSAWLEGEELDSESNLSHLDHAIACLAMLSHYQKHKLGTDDR